MVSQSSALLFDLDQFFTGGNSWQAALLQQVESLTLEQVLWKPAPDRHCIWDILLHINFWKQYVIAMARDTEKPNAETGNWSLAPEGATETNWQKEIERTGALQDDFKTVVAEMGDTLFATDVRISNYIRQLICHDAYHTGQIGTLRTMQGIKAVE